MKLDIFSQSKLISENQKGNQKFSFFTISKHIQGSLTFVLHSS